MGIPMPEAIIRKPKPSKDMKKLATLLLLFLYGMSEALAQTGYWTDEGNYDISWYSFAQREYVLTTPQQLAGLAYLAEKGGTISSDCKFELGNSISMEGHYWTPIKNFYATLDGKGYTLSNVTVHAQDPGANWKTGFVAGLYGDICNLTLDATCSVTVTTQTHQACIGGFAGEISGGASLINCHFAGNISVTSRGSGTSCQNDIGGIFGNGRGTVERCTNSGKINVSISATTSYANGHCIGGIVGMSYNGVSDCVNRGEVHVESRTVACVGGICGYAGGHTSYTSHIQGSSNEGLVSTEYTGTKSYTDISTGGIAGFVSDDAIVSECANHGTVESTNGIDYNSAEAGGIVGFNENLIINCYNTGTVQTKSANIATSGGIAGTNCREVINCYNSGTIIALGDASKGRYSEAGGIAGSNFQATSEEQHALIYNCYNTGTASGTTADASVGGIVGDCSHSSTTSILSRVEKCYTSTDMLPGIGLDEDGQEANITRMAEADMRSSKLQTELNNNLNAYNDTARQEKALLWWQADGELPTFLQADLLCDEITYTSARFTLQVEGSLTTQANVLYGTGIVMAIQAIRPNSPVTVDLLPNTTYKYYLQLKRGNTVLDYLEREFTTPSIVTRARAENVNRKGATLVAEFVPEMADRITGVEFILRDNNPSIDGTSTEIRLPATLTDGRAVAQADGLQARTYYQAELVVHWGDVDLPSTYFSFSTPDTGLKLEEATQIVCTQTTISMQMMLSGVTENYAGTIKECGIRYTTADDAFTDFNDSMNWNKVAGTEIEDMSTDQWPWFFTRLEGLTPGTRYALRPYVVVSFPNDGDVEELLYFEFDVLATLPVTVTTLPATNMTQTTALLSALFETGDAQVAERGFEVNYERYPLEGDATQLQLTGLTPGYGYSCRAYVTMTNGTTVFGEYEYFNTAPIRVLPQVLEVTQTSALVKVDCELGDAMPEEQGVEWKAGGETFRHAVDSTFRMTELPANSRVSYRGYTLANGSYIYSDWKDLNTLPISTAFEAADALSNMSGTLHATVECDTFSSARFGFEWRNYDAPELVPSNIVYATHVEDGAIAFALRGLAPSTYYKYRSFVQYQDREYFSEWTAFGTSHAFVLWPPTVHTIIITAPDGTSVTLVGYVVAGSEEVLQQGFEYWPVATLKRSEGRQTVLAEGDDLQATLHDLAPNTTYQYRAFVTTASGTTFGETMEFTTGSGSGIASPAATGFTVQLAPNPVKTSAVLRVNGVAEGMEVTCRVYSLQGSLAVLRQAQADGRGAVSIPLHRQDFRSGVYVVEVQAGGQSQTVKMIVE